VGGVVRWEDAGFGVMRDLGLAGADRFLMAGAGLTGMLMGGLGGIAGGMEV
jgi:hypothetical protein